MTNLESLYEKIGMEQLEELQTSIENNRNFSNELKKFLEEKKRLLKYNVEDFLVFLSKIKKVNRQQNNEKKDYSKKYEIEIIKDFIFSKYDDINTYLSSLNSNGEGSEEAEIFKFKVLENILYLFKKDVLREIFKHLEFDNFNGKNNIALFLANDDVLNTKKNLEFPFDNVEEFKKSYKAFNELFKMPEENQKIIDDFRLKKELNEEETEEETCLKNAFLTFFLQKNKYNVYGIVPDFLIDTAGNNKYLAFENLNENKFILNCLEEIKATFEKN